MHCPRQPTLPQRVASVGAMAEFVVPGKLSDLELPASGQPALDVGAMSAEEAEALVESA